LPKSRRWPEQRRDDHDPSRRQGPDPCWKAGGSVVGIANDQSIAWGCARAFRALGAEIAITYLNDKARRMSSPWRGTRGADLHADGHECRARLRPCSTGSPETWGRWISCMHSIAFSPKDTLQGRVTDAPRDGFLKTMDVSCWSFLRMAHLAEPLMKNGGTMFTMTYYGSQMVVENYNIMGVAKAALECAVRYMAAELGRRASASTPFRPARWPRARPPAYPSSTSCCPRRTKAPSRELVGIDDVGATCAFLAHDAARLMTGQVIYVDGGYHIID
jgi:enoyl-[acyl-carrier protein] reductase I